MHQIGFVEEMAVKLGVLRVLHQHMAGLADTGQQLVNGLRRIHHGVFGTDPVFTHGMVGAVKRMEGRMRQPGFVKVQVVDVAIEHALDGLGVVQNTVVSRLGQG